MRLLYTHKNKVYKNIILWIIAASMILSSINLDMSSAVAFSRRQNEIPLSAETCRSNTYRLYNDISTGEITGVKNTAATLDGSVQNKRRVLYHNNYLIHFMEKHTACSLIFKSLIRQSLRTGIDGVSKIIRYIHNQDGEKSRLILYIK